MEAKGDFKKRLGYLAFSIFFNAASNALMIDSNVGSAVWMASGVNISNLIRVDYGTTLFVYAILVAVTNQILLRKFDGHVFISNILFSLPFSYLVGFFTKLYIPLHFEQMNMIWRIVIDVIGLLGVSMAVSVYQRCNIIQHPNDELAYLLRFKYLRGSAGWGQIVSYSPPLIIMVICYFISGKIYAVGIGTVLAIFFQGYIIGRMDKIVIPSLKHHYNL
ncbi:DUF6198 family protein [Companilactobacillus keshanensis]|uniref:DUF6198 family protein n=1 Tax=Companilactobacillus keshanensis TaxID=2486003 RepID=A0ABW4BWX0_9LACO|nr:DUF6198 family protein [Companilactobacillus keshanensis]